MTNWKGSKADVNCVGPGVKIDDTHDDDDEDDDDDDEDDDDDDDNDDDDDVIEKEDGDHDDGNDNDIEIDVDEDGIIGKGCTNDIYAIFPTGRQREICAHSNKVFEKQRKTMTDIAKDGTNGKEWQRIAKAVKALWQRTKWFNGSDIFHRR